MNEEQLDLGYFNWESSVFDFFWANGSFGSFQSDELLLFFQDDMTPEDVYQEDLFRTLNRN